MQFIDRADAGKRLALELGKFREKVVIVYALPRGGVVVGAEVAKALHAPLDLIITRKIGHPNQPEYAIGAVSESGHIIYDDAAISGIDKNYLASEAKKQKLEAKRRREVYLQGKKPISCQGKIAILVDDGIATGLTMKAAIQELKLRSKPEKIIVAIPVAPLEIIHEMESEEKVEFITVNTSAVFLGAIGEYYEDFSPVEDGEVIKIMRSFST